MAAINLWVWEDRYKSEPPYLLSVSFKSFYFFISCLSNIFLRGFLDQFERTGTNISHPIVSIFLIFLYLLFIKYIFLRLCCQIRAWLFIKFLHTQRPPLISLLLYSIFQNKIFTNSTVSYRIFFFHCVLLRSLNGYYLGLSQGVKDLLVVGISFWIFALTSIVLYL